jgi:endothelin-converting enzyme
LQAAYEVCINYTAQEEHSLKPLAAFVRSIVDALPASSSITAENQTQDDSSAMGKTLTLFESHGIGSTQTIFFRQDNINPNENNLLIMPVATPALPSTEEEILEYVQVVSTLIAAIHPANKTVNQVSSLLGAAHKLEAKLAQLYQTVQPEALAKMLDPLAANTSIDEIQALAPQLNFKYVVRQLARKDTRWNESYWR